MIRSFWGWFLYPRPGVKTGWKLLFSAWIILDFCIAIFFSIFLNLDGFKFAEKTLFPAASILVSMAVAWTARASAILNDEKFRSKVVSDDRPLEDYIYSFQLSLLVLIGVIVYVAIMAAGGFNFYIINSEISKLSSTIFLFAFLSLAIRECWEVINFSNLLGLLGDKVPKDTK